MKWPRVRLADVAEVLGGSTPSRDRQDYWNGDIPWLTPTDLPMPGEGIAEVCDTTERITEAGLAAISASLLPPGTVLFSSRATIGKIGIAAVPLVTNQGFANFVPSKAILPNFLAYCLLYYREEISHLAGTTTFKEVRRGALKRFQIPLPPLSEQRRIVEILDQADALRKKRAEADAKAARILPALFHKMFGDPATNSKGWPVRPLGEAWQIVGGGTPSRTVQEFWRGSVPWASPKDMKTEILSDTEEHITAEAVSSSATRLVPPGSLLIVFRSGILVHTFPAAITAIDVAINQDLKALQPMGKNTNEYLFGLFAAAPTVPLACVKKGATVHNVDGARFSSLPIPLPPASLQRRFAEHLQTALGVKAQGRSVGRQIEDLFRTLLHRAFTGELTARWREAHMKELLAEMEAQSKLLEAVR